MSRLRPTNSVSVILAGQTLMLGLFFSAGPAAAAYINYFNAITGHYYALTLTNETYSAASAEAQSLGLSLATVNDAAENAWLVSTFSGVTSGRLWIGFSDEITEGVFLWDSGEPVTYTNWDPSTSEPNGGPANNDYTEIIITGAPASFGFWNDVDETGDLGALNWGIIESTQPIPEPSTAIMVIFGVLCIAGRCRLVATQ